MCSVLRHTNSVHILTSQFFTIYFNIIVRPSPAPPFCSMPIISLRSVQLAPIVCIIQDCSVVRREARCRCFSCSARGHDPREPVMPPQTSLVMTKPIALLSQRILGNMVGHKHVSTWQLNETGLTHGKSRHIGGCSGPVDGTMHLSDSDVDEFAGTALSEESWRGLRKDEYS